MIRFAFYLLFVVLLAGCNSVQQNKTSQSSSNKTEANQQSSSIKMVKVDVNLAQDGLVWGNTTQVNFKSNQEALPDSVRISLNTMYWQTQDPNDFVLTILPEKTILGKNIARFVFYWGDTLQATANLPLIYLSDVDPQAYGYKVLETFPHNIHSYTQGLEFSDNYLYEGTGQYGESKLIKIDLNKNEVVQSLNLSDDVFGEGITLFGDKIYQLTWRSQVGYVYDKNELKTLYEFSYPTEGWGLTNNGKELIMSDGSENIYFLDTEYIQEIRRIQVYDNQGPVQNLNELEYINGTIYANVYGSDFIVTIDPETGKVLGKIDLSGILNKKDVTAPIDVLNGIAYRESDKKLVVTGKLWPKMFAITLVKK